MNILLKKEKINVKITYINYGLKDKKKFCPINTEFYYYKNTTLKKFYKFLINNILKDLLEDWFFKSIKIDNETYGCIYITANNKTYNFFKFNISMKKILKIINQNNFEVSFSFCSGGDGFCIDTIDNLKITMHTNEFNHRYKPHIHVYYDFDKSASVDLKNAKILAGKLKTKDYKKIKKYINDNREKLYYLWALKTNGVDVNKSSLNILN